MKRNITEQREIYRDIYIERKRDRNGAKEEK